MVLWLTLKLALFASITNRIFIFKKRISRRKKIYQSIQKCMDLHNNFNSLSLYYTLHFAGVGPAAFTSSVSRRFLFDVFFAFPNLDSNAHKKAVHIPFYTSITHLIVCLKKLPFRIRW